MLYNGLALNKNIIIPANEFPFYFLSSLIFTPKVIAVTMLFVAFSHQLPRPSISSSVHRPLTLLEFLSSASFLHSHLTCIFCHLMQRQKPPYNAIWPNSKRKAELFILPPPQSKSPGFVQNPFLW